MAEKKQIAFVSERNVCRSLIAQACAQTYTKDAMNIHSFGFKPDRIHYLVKQVLDEKGHNTTFLFSKAYEVVERQKFDLIVLMNSDIKENLPDIPYSYELIEWNFEDPTLRQIPEEDMKKDIEKLYQAIDKEVRKLMDSFQS